MRNYLPVKTPLGHKNVNQSPRPSTSGYSRANRTCRTLPSISSVQAGTKTRRSLRRSNCVVSDDVTTQDDSSHDIREVILT